MKTRTTTRFITIMSLLLAVITIAYFESQTGERKIKQTKMGKGEQSGAGKQLNSWFLARAYPEPDNLNLKYALAWETFLQSRKGAEHPINGRTNSGSWTYIGPFNTIGGRALCIAIDPNNSDNLWVGTASGGMWKSTDAGANWTYVPVSNYSVLGVSSIIIDPTNSNVIYAGTGEVYRNGNSNIGFNVWKARGTYGVGILKSVNGGASWTQVMSKITSDIFAIQMLEFDPSNPATIYAAATDGLYRSTNSGTNWTKILNKTYVADVAIHPTDPLRITASVGNLVDTDKGIYYTTDGGTNWNAGTGLPAFTGFIRLDNTSSSNLYASVGGTSGNELYSSSNFGQSWTVHATSSHCGGQYWFSHDVAINPFHIDSLMMAGVSGYRYTVSGASRTTISGVHSDMHNIVYDPVYRGRIYIACDGGVYRSTNGGATWSNRNNGLGATQFYASLGVSPTVASLFVGGLQDNGVSRYNAGTWTHDVVGGDGGPSFFAPNGTTVLTSNDARAVHQSTSSGTSFTQRLSNLGQTYGVDERTGFMAPVAISKSNGQYMYVGSDNLHISTDGGGSFTRNTPASMTRAIEMTNKTAIALAVSPTNFNKVYVSTSPFAQMANNSLLYNPPPNVLRSTNASDNTNYTFSSIKGTLPDRFVMDFAISQTNDDSVFVVLGGFEDAGGSHIFVTGNGGTTWTDIGTSSILPDVPFNAILIDPINPQVLYAGCDFGVYVSTDRGTTWIDYNNGFTGTNLIMDLQMSADNLLVAATHGRGLATSPRYTGTLPVFFSSFKGNHQSGYNRLEWNTQNEYDLLKFELERSVDGRNYTRIASISPGNQNGSHSYRYDDRDLTSNTKAYYYRVKSIDLDGSFKFSPVLSLQSNMEKEFQVVNNPFNEFITVRSNLNSRQQVTIALHDVTGRIVRRKTFQGEPGPNSFILDRTSALPSGVYVMEATINDRRISLKVMKK